MPDDTLLINRQAELPDLLALGVLTPEQERMGYLSYGDLSLEQRAIVDQQLTALGVGKPEPVRESDLHGILAVAKGEESPDWDLPDWEDLASRIKRAIGGDRD